MVKWTGVQDLYTYNSHARRIARQQQIWVIENGGRKGIGCFVLETLHSQVLRDKHAASFSVWEKEVRRELLVVVWN